MFEPMAATKAKKGGRKVSRLTEVADEAARAAKRALLAETLLAQNWNLSATARALGLAGPSGVIRAIHDVGLDAEYERARETGLVKAGRPT
jgi:transcriptional regulator of acetoin/glycerol metabolism